MPVTDAPQVRAACDFNGQLNLSQTRLWDRACEDEDLPGLRAALGATADRPLPQSRTHPAAAHHLAFDEASCLAGRNIAIDRGITAGWTGYISSHRPTSGRKTWQDDI